MPAQPNPNPKKHAQQVYSGETSYPAYVVEIQEINLRSGRVLPDNQPPSPPKALEEEKEESVPKANPPPFPKRLIHPNHHTPKETELLGELKKLCVKMPLLQAIKDVPVYNKLTKEKCFKHPGKIKKDITTINVIE